MITTFMEHTRLCRVLFWILYEFMQYIVDGWKNHSEMPIDHPGKQRIIRVKEFLTSTKLQLTWCGTNLNHLIQSLYQPLHKLSTISWAVKQKI